MDLGGVLNFKGRKGIGLALLFCRRLALDAPFGCRPRKLDTVTESLNPHFVRIPSQLRIHSAFIKNRWILEGFW
jgi:hypothetical protein